jgi:hypothetical protein
MRAFVVFAARQSEAKRHARRRMDVVSLFQRHVLKFAPQSRLLRGLSSASRFDHQESRLRHPIKLTATVGLALATLATALPSAQAAGPGTDAIAGKAWVETKSQSGLPGVMLVFLPDGTLLMDSCWETYALRKWSRGGADALSWDEDGAKISAKIKSVTANQLTLQVKAGRDIVEHRYTAAKAPYICPDMKR